MKTTVVRLLLALIVLCAVTIKVEASSLLWTNTAGGDWSVAANWSPNQVPVSGDDVIITNSGDYIITNTTAVTLDQLTLGGNTNGTQTLIMSSLTLSSIGMVSSNGVLNWNGGTINGALTVGQGGMLNLTNNSALSIFGSITNIGTVNWSAGSISGFGPPSYRGVIYNAGLWNAQFDGSVNLSSGQPLFINVGTFRKSGGTGTTTVGWNFNSIGSFDVQTGSLSISTWANDSTLNGNYTGVISVSDTNATILVASNAVLNWSGGTMQGTMTVAQGGVMNVTNAATYTIFSSFTNNGTVNWSAGNINGFGPPGYNGLIYNAGLWNAQFDGTLNLSSGAPVFINAGTFRKSAGTGNTTIGWNFTSIGTIDTQTGSLSCSTWAGNSILNGNYTGTINIQDTNATVLVASNAVLNWNSGTLSGALTVGQGGVLNFTNDSTFTIFGSLTNNGTVNWLAGNINGYGPPSYHGFIYNAGLWDAKSDRTLGVNSGTPTFVNAGTFRKSAGTGVTTIYWNFTSTGILDVQTGSLSTSAWTGDNTLNGNYKGSISVNSNSTVTVPANVTVDWTSGTIADGGSLNVSSNGVINWGGGTMSGALTVAEGGVLNITNNSTYTIFGSITNNGTVNWSAGNINGYGPPTYKGFIYNAGLWNAQFDGTLGINSGTPTFINTGTFRKSGGTGNTTVNWSFNSTGAFDTQTGSFSSSSWIGDNVLNGNYTGTINLSDTNVTVLVASNAVLNWNSGSISGSLTMAQGGILNLTNDTTFIIFGALTNNGTVNWLAGTLNGYGPPTYHGFIYNTGLWNAQSDRTLGINSGTPTFINAGTFRKIGGAGTTTVYWNFTNSVGMLDAQTNTISLGGNYDLSGGTLNFGLNDLTHYGIIHLSSSPAALTGTLSANLNNGYVPATGSSFSVLTYSSKTGAFTNFDLPFPVAWQTNYGGTAFTLTVLNVRPVLQTIATQNFDELTTLNINATATDMDSGQSLTYGLVSGPHGLTVSPSGVISWTPDETQGPSSNIVFVQVTDNGTPTLSATNSFVVTVNEINVPPQLTVPIDQSVNELTTLSVSASATDSDIPTNPLSFALVSPPRGMTINTSTGAISWTPAEDQGPGVYPIHVVVTDLNTNAINQQSFSVTNSFTVTVNEVNTSPVLTLPPNADINELVPYSANATATDSDIPANPLRFTLVSGPVGLTVSPTGAISWTPTEQDGPSTNTVTIAVTDTNLAAVNATSLSVTNSYQIVVREVNTAPVLIPIGDSTVNPGQTISFTATATDADVPTNILTFSLLSPPAGATINSGTGLFNWRPTIAQANTTNTVKVKVTDDGSPNLSATNSFTVVVKQLGGVTLTPLGFTGGQFKMQVDGTTGPDYIIMASDSVTTNFTDVMTNVSPATPFQYTDTNAFSATNHFYRVRLSP